MTAGDSKDLEPIIVVATEFEAQTKAAILESEGISCKVITKAPSWTGLVPLSSSAVGAAIIVSPQDLEKAKELLKSRIEDSVDLDWDEVDVGEREDSLPLTPVGHMPILAKIAFTIVLLSVLLSVLVGLLGLVLGFVF